MHTTPTDAQMLSAFNSCEKVIDGLHAVFQLAAPSTSPEMDMLKVENKRLREALTTIGNWGGTTRFYGSGSYTDVARAALKGGE